MSPPPKLLFLSLAFGSIKPTLDSCSGWGNEKPRKTIALTTVNCVVAPPMPRASTSTARKQNDFSLKRRRRPTRGSGRKDPKNIVSYFIQCAMLELDQHASLDAPVTRSQ